MRHRPAPEPFSFGELDFETIVTTSGPAWSLRLGLESAGPLPEGTAVWLWLREDGDHIPAAHPRWGDREGDLCLKATTEEGDDGLQCVATLPFAALPSPCPRDLELYATLGDDEEVLAEGSWEVTLPSRAEREEGHLLGAFVGAAAEVVEELTDAQAARIEEVLQEAWRLDEHGLGMLRRAIARARSERSNPERWEEALSALDEDEQAHLAEFLLAVLEAGGGPTDEDDDAVQAFFESFEFDVGIWHACLEEAEEKDESSPSPEEALRALELSPGAGWDEVHAAFRRLAADYHPDKVAHLPKGFQEFATTRMQEINEAYRQLKAHFRR